NESVDVDRLFVRRPQLVHFLLVDDNVLPLAVLEARDDLVIRDLAVDRAGLLVVDPAVALFVKLVQMDRSGVAGRGRIRLDGQSHETEFEESLPARTGWHGVSAEGWSPPCDGHLRFLAIVKEPKGQLAGFASGGSAAIHYHDHPP